jgi:hypothetical protein
MQHHVEQRENRKAHGRDESLHRLMMFKTAWSAEVMAVATAMTAAGTFAVA